MADLWPRAQEPEQTSDLVAYLHDKVFDLFRDIIEEKAEHHVPFLPEGKFICYNCQGSLQVTGFGPPFFCLLYTSPSPRDRTRSRMPSSA